jgi:hypothetical protein
VRLTFSLPPSLPPPSIQIEEQREWKEGDKNETNGDERSSESDAPVDNLIIYRQILEILKPGETVVKVSTP